VILQAKHILKQILQTRLKSKNKTPAYHHIVYTLHVEILTVKTTEYSTD